MSSAIAIDVEQTTEFLCKLLKTPSPTGNTAQAVSLAQTYFQSARPDASFQHTIKGGLLATLPGLAGDAPRTITAHVDTLGAMVKEIKENGRLKLSAIGGYLPASVVGEYCAVETGQGRRVLGTVLLSKQSVHVHPAKDIHELGSDLNNLEVRLDERTKSQAETEALGIQVGDFVAWDPRLEVTDSGFVKSRHLDDKASVAAIFAAVEAMRRAGISPAQTTHIFISNYEEVGHGGATGIPPDSRDLVVVDMGAIGEGQAGDEFSVSICVKDATGPYDLGLRRHLVALAEAAGIPYNLDIYVNYGSDGSAALRAGLDARVALLGPGVDSSHAYERTHLDSIENTARLLVEYLRT
ncbi:MAG: M42 family metallopeptidase [Anaerolineae bacterium]